MNLHRTLFCIVVPSALALFSGCKDKQEIKVYRVSKVQEEPVAPVSSPAVAPPMGQMPEGHPALGGGMPAMGAPAMGGDGEQTPQVTSAPPSNWEAQPLSSMRQASYLVKGENGASADISIVVLGGGAGGILENINRWLSQLGQPAINEEKLAQMARHVTLPLGDVTVVDLEGLPQGADATKDGRIVAGIASSAGQTIFFKMRGNAALAASQKEAFIKWIGTVRMTEAAESPAASVGTAPAITAPAAVPGMSATPSMAAALPMADTDKSKIKWEVPAGWNPVPPSSMRIASFAVAGQNGEALDISVSSLGGDGGGDLGNVNRWRGQIGLSPLSETDLKQLIVPLKAKDGEVLTVDMAGPKARVLAGWAKIEGQTWFFKLTGPAALAAGEKEKFTKFIQSVQFHP